MFKRFLLISLISLTILNATQAGCDDCATSVGSEIQSGSNPKLIAASLLGEIEIWLASNLDLPTTKERPAIAIVSQAQLVAKRLQQNSPSEGAAHAPILLNVGSLPFMTIVQEPSFLQMIGWEHHLPTNRSWFMKWFIIFKILLGSNTSVPWRERSQPIWPKTSGWGNSGSVLRKSSTWTCLPSSLLRLALTDGCFAA